MFHFEILLTGELNKNRLTFCPQESQVIYSIHRCVEESLIVIYVEEEEKIEPDFMTAYL